MCGLEVGGVESREPESQTWCVLCLHHVWVCQARVVSSSEVQAGGPPSPGDFEWKEKERKRFISSEL